MALFGLVPWILFLAAPSLTASEGIVELTATTIDAYVETRKYTLLVFYAPWCEHCKAFMPEFDAAATELESLGIALGKVDGDSEKSLKTRFNVRHYPAVLWFEGTRSTVLPRPGIVRETIVSDAKRLLLEATTPAVEEVLEVPQPINARPNFVVFAAELPSGFLEAAEPRRSSASWYFVRTPGQSRVELQHRGEEPRQLAKGASATAKEVADFLWRNQVPLVGILDASNFATYLAGERGLIWYLFPSEVGGEAEMWNLLEQHRSDMLRVKQAVKGKYSVILTDTKDYGTAIAQHFGQVPLPAVVLMPAITVQRVHNRKSGDRVHFRHTGDMTSGAVLSFLEGLETAKVWKVEPGSTHAEEL